MANTPDYIKGLNLVCTNTRTGQTSSLYLHMDAEGKMPANSIERIMSWGMSLYAAGWDREEISITGMEKQNVTINIMKPPK